MEVVVVDREGPATLNSPLRACGGPGGREGVGVPRQWWRQRHKLWHRHRQEGMALMP